MPELSRSLLRCYHVLASVASVQPPCAQHRGLGSATETDYSSWHGPGNWHVEGTGSILLIFEGCLVTAECAYVTRGLPTPVPASHFESLSIMTKSEEDKTAWKHTLMSGTDNHCHRMGSSRMRLSSRTPLQLRLSAPVAVSCPRMRASHVEGAPASPKFQHAVCNTRCLA